MQQNKKNIEKNEVEQLTKKYQLFEFYVTATI